MTVHLSLIWGGGLLCDPSFFLYGRLPQLEATLPQLEATLLCETLICAAVCFTGNSAGRVSRA